MPKPVRKMQKANAAAQTAMLAKIPSELLDRLVKGPMTAEAVEDVSRAFKKALIERALGASPNTVHLMILIVLPMLIAGRWRACRRRIGNLLILRLTPRGFRRPRLDTTRSCRISRSTHS